MSTKKKLLEAAAGNAGEAVYVDDVFSTYLYEGTGSNKTITNGIDLSGEGGLVWIKDRDNTYDHALYDTERGIYKYLESNQTGAEVSNTTHLRAFNSDGFDIGVNLQINTSAADYASWTFRKQPGFFDVVTYTGDGTANRQVTHNLGSVPGCILLKRYDTADDWKVYHVGADATAPEDYVLELNSTNARQDSVSAWNDTAPTSSNFTVNSGGSYNASGGTYVAYLFAHDAQDFGENSNEAIIKCGSYTGNGSADGPEIDLGFEPQWLLLKNASSPGDWMIFDVMRGWSPGDNNNKRLYPNLSNVESGTTDRLLIQANGFKVITSQSPYNNNGDTYIYIAIRRPMKTPESGTEVFKPTLYTGNSSQQTLSGFGFPSDIVINKNRSSTASTGSFLTSRLTSGGNYLRTNLTAAELTGFGSIGFDEQDGITLPSLTNINGSGTTYVAYAFKRAPGFFDVVAYTGDGQTTQTLNHNLGVTPELMIGKRRNDTQNWVVYHSLVGAGKYYNLNTTSGASTLSTVWGGVAPTSTQFTVGNSTTVNFNGDSYISYHFATLAGVSKVGSYTGTGANLNVDCGFSAGARFILIKRSDSTGDWYVWDTERGIVAGNDPYVLLNTTAAEVTSTDYIDPLSSGFTVTSSAPAALNASGGTYIFLAIA